MLIPGYTTLGVAEIEGKIRLEYGAVNEELASIMSACPVNSKQGRSKVVVYARVVISSHQSIGNR